MKPPLSSENGVDRLSQGEILARCVEAYVFTYPCAVMEASRREATREDAGERAPMNKIMHTRTTHDAGFTAVVRPNADTLYSKIWWDVSDEPLVITVPDVGDRYYVLDAMDYWTNVNATIGPRTTGSGAGKFLIVGPDWRESAPEGFRVVRSTTRLGWSHLRIQVNGPDDEAAVNELQDKFVFTPLSHYLTRSDGRQVPLTTDPVFDVEKLGAADYFEMVSAIMKQNPAHVADRAQTLRLEPLGLAPGQDFSWDAAPDSLKEALTQAIPEGIKKIKEGYSRFDLYPTGWSASGQIGNFGVDYLRRATVAFLGLGALPPQDAMYPMAIVDDRGEPLTGEHAYRIHFPPEGIPPVHAFWSLTMYGPNQLFIDNPLNRYALGDRSNLIFNDDGSLDLHIRHAAPGGDQDRNWLPAPGGAFSMNLRLYWPDERAVDHDWDPPAVVRVD